VVGDVSVSKTVGVLSAQTADKPQCGLISIYDNLTASSFCISDICMLSVLTIAAHVMQRDPLRRNKKKLQEVY
jgi:hypothetical protein